MIFQNLTYNLENPCCNKKLIPVLFIMTSNAHDDFYLDLVNQYKQSLDSFVSPTTTFVSGNTLQLRDYSKTDWEWSMFNINEKIERHKTVFPEECKKVYELASTIF